MFVLFVHVCAHVLQVYFYVVCTCIHFSVVLLCMCACSYSILYTLYSMCMCICICLPLSVCAYFCASRTRQKSEAEDAQNVVISLKGANVHCNFGAFRKKIWPRV